MPAVVATQRVSGPRNSPVRPTTLLLSDTYSEPARTPHGAGGSRRLRAVIRDPSGDMANTIRSYTRMASSPSRPSTVISHATQSPAALRRRRSLRRAWLLDAPGCTRGGGASGAALHRKARRLPSEASVRLPGHSAATPGAPFASVRARLRAFVRNRPPIAQISYSSLPVCSAHAARAGGVWTRPPWTYVDPVPRRTRIVHRPAHAVSSHARPLWCEDRE